MYKPIIATITTIFVGYLFVGIASLELSPNWEPRLWLILTATPTIIIPIILIWVSHFSK